jgi:alginate O-acetyltransferase complex protein AlgI
MLFTDPMFVLLVVVTGLLYYLPATCRWQPWWMSLAGLVFYAWESPGLLSLLLASIAVNVIASHRVAHGRASLRLPWAVGGVVANLGMLLFFKYSPLFARTVLDDGDSSIGRFLIQLPLPIGISFFTFQGISLMVEVYRSNHSSPVPDDQALVPRNFADHLGNTMLFKSFFPNLIAGPIIKAHEFYPQIQPKRFAEIPWNAAFRALVTGYFLKMVVADNLRESTFWITHPFFLGQSTVTLLALLFGYSMQIFADFAGYSLIAIGLAALFGYRLPANFRQPYLSRSFAEFWRRWHISLSTWLRDYLYLPLGGNRRGACRTYANLFVVMLLGGLWHGAAWSYAVWGALHGAALALERCCRGHIRLPDHPLIAVPRALGVFAFVSLAWLLFKLPSFPQVLDYIGAIAANEGPTKPLRVCHILFYSAPVVALHGWHLLKGGRFDPTRLEPVALGLMLAGIVVESGTPGAFIYFQF